MVPCTTDLTEALKRLQATTGPLGLDVSVRKTEWLWLSCSNAGQHADKKTAQGTNLRASAVTYTDVMSETQLADIVHLNGQV